LIWRIETFKLNPSFDRARFLKACGLLPHDYPADSSVKGS
jgi:hypothetical protein